MAGTPTPGWDVFVTDLRLDRTVRVSVGDRGQQAVKSAPDFPGDGPDSFGGSISASGRAVTYRSNADNLVRGDTNRLVDIFVSRVR